MDRSSLRQIVIERAEAAQVALLPNVFDQLVQYYELLAHWNERINLTSFILDHPTPEAVDRLLIEPLAALSIIPTHTAIWFDLGSGGGSPAIPIQIARPAKRLVMVESRERKAAFLREAIRELRLTAEVQAARIEAIVANQANLGLADLVTVRAVRADASLLSAIHVLLRLGGQAVLFGAKGEMHFPRGLELVSIGPIFNVARRQGI